MTTLHIENTVHDYEAWQEPFDKFERFRAEHGVRSYRHHPAAADPQQVTVDLDFDSRRATPRRSCPGSSRSGLRRSRSGCGRPPPRRSCSRSSATACCQP